MALFDREKNKRLREVESEYESRFESEALFNLPVMTRHWDEDDLIHIYEVCLADDKPFDYNDTK